MTEYFGISGQVIRAYYFERMSVEEIMRAFDLEYIEVCSIILS